MSKKGKCTLGHTTETEDLRRRRIRAPARKCWKNIHTSHSPAHGSVWLSGNGWLPVLESDSWPSMRCLPSPFRDYLVSNCARWRHRRACKICHNIFVIDKSYEYSICSSSHIPPKVKVTKVNHMTRRYSIYIYIALVPITTKGYPFKRIFKKDRVWWPSEIFCRNRRFVNGSRSY